MINIYNTNVQGRLDTIHQTMSLTITACSSQCAEQNEIKLTGERYERVWNKLRLMNQIMGVNKPKSGLVNAIGDLSKTLFETLSNDDLEKINREFDQVYSNSKEVSQVLQNHTKILKILLDSSSVKYGRLALLLKSENRQAGELQGSLKKNTRNLFIASKIVTCRIIIKELQEDINTLITAINDGKHVIIHPQVLTPQKLINTINEFETVHRTRYHFHVNPRSY